MTSGQSTRHEMTRLKLPLASAFKTAFFSPGLWSSDSPSCKSPTPLPPPLASSTITRGPRESLSFPLPRLPMLAPTAGYLILHQHGDVHEHVVELLDATLQPHDVLVPPLDLAEGLLGNLRVDDLQEAMQRPAIGHHPRLRPSHLLPSPPFASYPLPVEHPGGPLL